MIMLSQLEQSSGEWVGVRVGKQGIMGVGRLLIYMVAGVNGTWSPLCRLEHKEIDYDLKATTYNMCKTDRDPGSGHDNPWPYCHFSAKESTFDGCFLFFFPCEKIWFDPSLKV